MYTHTHTVMNSTTAYQTSSYTAYSGIVECLFTVVGVCVFTLGALIQHQRRQRRRGEDAATAVATMNHSSLVAYSDRPVNE